VIVMLHRDGLEKLTGNDRPCWGFYDPASSGRHVILPSHGLVHRRDFRAILYARIMNFNVEN
jgi:hypothetical protein